VRIWLFRVLLGGAALLAGAPPASAEIGVGIDGSACYDEVQVWPHSGLDVPADVPALVFKTARSPSVRTIDEYMIELRGSDGAVVPYTAVADGDEGFYLLRLAGPLELGTLQIKYLNLCSPVPGTFTTSTAYVVPSPGAPASIGTATATIVGSVDPCSLPAEVFFYVNVQLDPAMAAYKSVTSWRVSYGSVSGHGYGFGDFGPDSLQYTVGGVCEAGQEVTVPVTIGGRIAGASSDLPDLLVEARYVCPLPGTGVACGQDGGIGGAEVIDGAVASDAPGGADATSSGDRDSGTPGAPPRKSGGCSVAGTHSNWSPPHGLILALAFVLVKARGRRRSGSRG